MNAKRDRFPITVKRGSCTVKIYRDCKPTGTYYRVAYHIGGKRYRLNFTDLKEAKAEAEAQASKLSRGDVDAALLNGKDRLIYGRALEALCETGTALDAAALEYSDARKHLDGVSLVDAAKFYARHHGRNIARKPVADAIEEMITAKKGAGVSQVYLRDLKYRLGTFKEAFRCDVYSITPQDVATFFADLKLSPRSYNNFLRTLRTFFRFAQKQRWLSKETDLLETIERRKEKGSPVEIYAPSELADLLTHARADIVPCIALAAFAGLRAEEILRLEWADVDRRPGFIEVAAHKAKTAMRRLVPITENLAQWLATAPRISSRVWPRSKDGFFKVLARTASRAKMEWKQNALRHSFISYRLADVQDINRVSLEAGNSPQMIFRHYRELATPEQARTWFAITAQAGPNVVPITAAHGKPSERMENNRQLMMASE
jgi:integrase